MLTSPINILLIDDDEDDYILTKDLLSKGINIRKYQLAWCNSYFEGINQVLKESYDVYLVDYRLGKYSGLDLLNEAIKSNCSKPIIILTGKGDSRIDEKAQELGAADYLVKDEINDSLLERSIRYTINHYKTLEELRESENKFRIIFERSKTPMLICNSEGEIIETNHSATDFFNTSREVFLAAKVDALFKNKHSSELFRSSMAEKGAVTDLEAELITGDGMPKYCSISSFSKISQHGNTERHYLTIHDLTYRKLQERQAIVEEKLAAIERVAKKLALEINNPLSNVNLAIDELKAGNISDQDLMIVDLIRRNCDRIGQLTSELIQSTQVVDIEMKPTNFRRLLEDVIVEAENMFNVSIRLIGDSSDIQINADEINLKTVFMNIFQNSAEAAGCDGGSIVVDIRNKGQQIEVAIKDTGTGISAQHLDKIFEPFFTTKSRAPGLGLTLAQRILQSHNGQIEITSNGSDETTAYIILPVNPVFPAY